jgi:mRNA-capping enzyme
METAEGCNFAAFKVPLDDRFTGNLPEKAVWTPTQAREKYPELGFVIDLTKALPGRFYDQEKEFVTHKIRYQKHPCEGHEGAPTEQQTAAFIQLCKEFWEKNPGKTIGVHCTHGFNRTGFLISAYLVENCDMSVEAAAWKFAEHRPSGIYKPEYVQELCDRYDGVTEDMPPTYPPAWGATDEDFFAAVKNLLENLNRQKVLPIDGDALAETERLMAEAVKVIPDDGFHAALEFSGWNYEHCGFLEPVSEDNRATLVECLEQAHMDRSSAGVGGGAGAGGGDPAQERKRMENDESETAQGAGIFAMCPQLIRPAPPPIQGKIRQKCRELVGASRGSGFPGQQPVSVDGTNIRTIVEDDYLVSWKADGTRYLMYIDNGVVYMIGRDNCVFEVPYMDTFPDRAGKGKVRNTLLDGELVKDTCWVEVPPPRDPKGNLIPNGKPTRMERYQWNYYAYDCVQCFDKSLVDRDYNKRRSYLQGEVIDPRNGFAKKRNPTPQFNPPPSITPPGDAATFMIKKRPPFGVKVKEFVPLLGSVSNIAQLSGFDAIQERMHKSEELRTQKSVARFPGQIEHEMDGLIFASVKQVYERGSCLTLLKWKPPDMNSIDFLFKVYEEPSRGTTIYVAHLFVNDQGGEVEFTAFGNSTMRSKNAVMLQYDGKIVECFWKKDKRSWEAMRVRTDKTHPNSLHTAQNIHRSITDGIEQAALATMIKKRRLFCHFDLKKEEEKRMKRKRENGD